MSDALVIGGGPAGAALAIRLARAGREVVLLERTTAATDKVCGEFVSSEALDDLGQLGLELGPLGAVSIGAVRLCQGPHTSTIELPFPARSVSRRVLDEALLERAAAVGVEVRRGAKVREVGRRTPIWQARLSSGELIESPAAFLATGKHDLRGRKRPEGRQSDLVAFKLHLQLAPKQAAALAGHVELTLFEGGYAGLQMIEGARANLCLVIRRHCIGQAMADPWIQTLSRVRADSALLDARLVGARPCWDKPLALSAIPYGYIRRRSDGVWRLGDQAAVIPSFCGDGIAIALHSAALAGATYLAGKSADAYQRRLAHELRGQMLLATLVSRALVRPVAQRALSRLAHAWPSAMALVAAYTRVPAAALARATHP